MIMHRNTIRFVQNRTKAGYGFRDHTYLLTNGTGAFLIIYENGITCNILKYERKGEMYEKLQQLIDSRGITTYQLAKETGIAPSRFSQWKNGSCKPKTDKLQKIAEYFGVTIEYFLE